MRRDPLTGQFELDDTIHCVLCRTRLDEEGFHDPVRLYPGDHAPDLEYFDDDWFRYYFHPDGLWDLDPQPHTDCLMFVEVHELCDPAACSYRPHTPCPFHKEAAA